MEFGDQTLVLQTETSISYPTVSVDLISAGLSVQQGKDIVQRFFSSAAWASGSGIQLTYVNVSSTPGNLGVEVNFISHCDNTSIGRACGTGIDANLGLGDYW
jgi:hypothetical protein